MPTKRTMTFRKLRVQVPRRRKTKLVGTLKREVHRPHTATSPTSAAVTAATTASYTKARRQSYKASHCPSIFKQPLRSDQRNAGTNQPQQQPRASTPTTYHRQPTYMHQSPHKQHRPSLTRSRGYYCLEEDDFPMTVAEPQACGGRGKRQTSARLQSAQLYYVPYKPDTFLDEESFEEEEVEPFARFPSVGYRTQHHRSKPTWTASVERG